MSVQRAVILRMGRPEDVAERIFELIVSDAAESGCVLKVTKEEGKVYVT